MAILLNSLVNEVPAKKRASSKAKAALRRDSGLTNTSHAAEANNFTNMKISWCQADVDKWSKYFGREVDVQSRVFLQNAIGGSALTMKGGNIVGS